MAKVAAKEPKSDKRTKPAPSRSTSEQEPARGKQPPTKARPRRKRERVFRAFVPFAIRSDGAVLINVNECEGRSIKGRERFTGAVLRPSEARIAFGGLDDGLSSAAAQIAGKMPRTRRRARRGSGE